MRLVREAVGGGEIPGRAAARANRDTLIADTPRRHGPFLQSHPTVSEFTGVTPNTSELPDATE